MHPATQRYIELLTENVERWEQAAHDIDVMLPRIPELDRDHWREKAQVYRERANEYKRLIEHAKTPPGFNEDADGS